MTIVNIYPPSSNGLSSARGTRIETHDGHPIHGVKRINIDLRLDAPITAHLEVYAIPGEIKGAKSHFQMVDPLTGEKKEIEIIMFKDGSTFKGSE